MQGVLNGFAVIAVVIGVGYLIGRRGYLGDNGREVLTKLAFHVATPALLFTTLAQADLSVILSNRLLVTAISTFAMAGVFVAVGAVRRWGVGRTTIGALCSSYVNAGNLGIPIAVYVLGDASLVAPVLLFQQIVMTPVALTVLDLSGPGEKTSLWRRVTDSRSQPVGIGSLSGVAVSASGLTVPGPVLDPLTLIGEHVGPGRSPGLRHLPVRQHDAGPRPRPDPCPSLRRPEVGGPAPDGLGPGGGSLRPAGRPTPRRGGHVGPARRPEPLHVRVAVPGRRGPGAGVDPAVDDGCGAGAGGGGGGAG